MGNFNSILNCANSSLAPSTGGTLTNPTINGGAVTNATINNAVIGGTTPAAASVTAPAAGDSSARAITSAWYGQNLPGGLVNKFRNATMDVWQRGTASTTIATSGAYTADGWFVVPVGSGVTVAAAAGIDYTVNSLQIAGASGVTDVLLKQPIESYISAPFHSQSVTVQFKFANSTGGSVTPALTVKIPTAQDNYASSTNLVSAASLQSSASGATCTEAYTFTGSASSNLGTEIDIDFGNNFSTTAKSVKIADLDIRVTPGVATGLNANPPPPELRPIATELALCRRYFETSYANGAAPGSVTTNGALWYYNLISGTQTQAGLYIRYQAEKRVLPTVTFYSPNSGASGKYYSAPAGGDQSPSSSQYPGQNGIDLYGIQSAIANFQMAVHFTASAEIAP